MDQLDAPSPIAATPPPASPRARRSWLRRWLVGAASGLLAGIVVGLGALALLLLLLSLPGGTRFVLEHVPGLRVVQPRGSLLHSFTAQRIEFDLPGSPTLPRVSIDDFAWLGFRVEPVGAASSGWGVALDTLRAGRVVVVSPPASPRTAPAALPASLALPLGVRIGQLRIASLQWSALGGAPLTDIRARLSLQQRAGKLAQHRVDELSLHWKQWTGTGHASVALRSPYALDAQFDLRSPSAVAGGAHLQGTVGGSLARTAVRVDAEAGAQHARATLELTPFGTGPLQRAEVEAQGFDLALLDPGAPQTRLSGRLTVQPPPSEVEAPHAPARTAAPPGDTLLDVQGAWRNELAGRWSDGRLPVRAMQLLAQVAARDGRVGRLDRLNVELGAQAGGRVQASGRWNLRPGGHDASGWTLQAQIDQLRAAQLDARAPPLLISGPLQLRGAAPLSAHLDLSAELSGRTDTSAAGQSVVLKVQAAVAPDDIRVDMLQAQAGAAQLNLSGSARRQDGQWRLRSTGRWSHFDPQLWWPAWFPERQQAERRNDLSGQLDGDLGWRPTADAESSGGLAAWLSSVTGQARVSLERSQLQGVPVSAQIELRAPAAAATTTLDASLNLAGNHVGVSGRLDRVRPAQDHWTAELALGDLHALAPVARLLRLDEPAGTIGGSLQATGRWPAMRSDGAVHAQDVTLHWLAPAATGQAADTPRQVALKQLSADWHWGAMWGDATAPVQTHLDVAGLQLGGWRVDHLQASSSGTVRDHQASLTVDAVLPPGLATSLQPLLHRRQATADLPVHGQIDLHGQGRVDAQRGGWSWQAQWRRVLLQPEPGSVAGNTLGDRPWLRVEPFETTLSSQAARTTFDTTPLRLTLAGADLAVQQLHWAGAAAGEGGPGALDVDAELAPIEVARVLAALQPDFGWGGDLSIGGHLRVHRSAAARAPLSLDAELARRGGDLTLTDAAAEGGAVQHLRLEALRLAVSAKAGEWRFEQQLTGRRFGTLTGVQTLATAPTAWWPDAHAPLDGRLDIDVANLRLWGLWVPAGWRLAGQLQGRTTFKGSLAEPQMGGHLSGHQLGVRNLIQGVDFDQGELDLAFDGAQARLDRFSLRAGQGELNLTGTARLDAHPEAQLHLALQHFAALQRIDRRAVISGQADLALQTDSLSARGAFSLDEGLFDISKAGAPTLDDDVRRVGVDDVVTDPADERAAARKAPRKVDLDVLLDLGSQMRLRGYGLDTRLAGQLKLSSGPPTYKPVLRGTIRTMNGTFAAYGQKLVIDRGTIQFNGALDNPALDIQATRPSTRGASSAGLTATTGDSDVRVGVTVTGTAQNPRIRLFSDPEMSDTDKLSWLVLGHASSGLGGADLSVLQGAAAALMGGDSSGANESLFQSLGLDEMSVRQSDTGTRDTVLTVGKQISQRWYVGYERGLNATTGTWQLIYRLAQRFTLRAQSGLDNSLDFIWVWRWN